MRKNLYTVLTVIAVSISMFMTISCNDGETYAEKKENEKNAIYDFLSDNKLIGPIVILTEQQFYDQDSITDVTKNEFVLFNDDGIYMQIINKGEGQTMVEMAKERPDSTINKKILCRFLEYNIADADTTYTNYYSPSIVDKIQLSYSHYSRSYSGSFTEGYMLQYHEASVPQGWMKPLDFIRLSRDPAKIAKVRLIVPHASGTNTASGYVQPYYYEISYQLGR
ncbi:MAG: DUF4827 domain-containing protein [Bacteroidaceae bacterium]|nr:DUF4827 domain-containing protein [Bacteroidaceae bacterium]